MRGVRKSATQQPREPGFVLHSLTAIVEFVKEHTELYDKEHGRFHDRQRKEAIWAEISAELKLQPFDVRRWLWQALQATVWTSPKGDDQETVLGLPADGFP